MPKRDLSASPAHLSHPSWTRCNPCIMRVMIMLCLRGSSSALLLYQESDAHAGRQSVGGALPFLLCCSVLERCNEGNL